LIETQSVLGGGAASEGNSCPSSTITPSQLVEKSKSPPATPLEINHEAKDIDRHTSDSEFGVSKYLSVDDQGQVDVFGLTSTLHNPGRPSLPNMPTSSQEFRNQLVANAALERQKEFSFRPST
jgi:hypothetical protein